MRLHSFMLSTTIPCKQFVLNEYPHDENYGWTCSSRNRSPLDSDHRFCCGSIFQICPYTAQRTVSSQIDRNTGLSYEGFTGCAAVSELTTPLTSFWECPGQEMENIPQLRFTQHVRAQRLYRMNMLWDEPSSTNGKGELQSLPSRQCFPIVMISTMRDCGQMLSSFSPYLNYHESIAQGFGGGVWKSPRFSFTFF